MRAHTVRCASRSTFRLWKDLRAICITFFEKKKQPLAKQKIQEPSALKRKILAGTCHRRTGEGDKKMSELHCFLHSKVYEQGRALVRMPRL